MKSILITGCSSGIGYATAKQLQQLGWRVFASCRQPADVVRLQAEGLECLLLDAKDMAVVSKWWESGNEALEQWRDFCREDSERPNAKLTGSGTESG